jgi:hypothetical protein
MLSKIGHLDGDGPRPLDLGTPFGRVATPASPETKLQTSLSRALQTAADNFGYVKAALPSSFGVLPKNFKP